MAYHPIDVQVGARLRQRRILLGVSQLALGEFVGVTPQQVIKYERGANRLYASRLYEFAKILDVRISYFFHRMPAEDTPNSKRGGRETLELVRAYYKIDNISVRKAIVNTMRSLG